VSREKPELGNSVFTYYFLEALRGKADRNNDGIVTLQEAYEYLYEKTKDETAGGQHPKLRANLQGEFPMSLVSLQSPTLGLPQVPHPSQSHPRDADEVRKLVRKAEQGDANAQFMLGLAYRDGSLGFSRDDSEAAKWIRKSATQGHDGAKALLESIRTASIPTSEQSQQSQVTVTRSSLTVDEKISSLVSQANFGEARAKFELGEIYQRGYGVPQDYKKAVDWYRKAAEQGHSDGQLGLARMYSNGWGVPKEEAEALKWYRKAAENGNLHAQYDLSSMYVGGHGVRKDFDRGIEWFLKAAKTGEYGVGGNCIFREPVAVRKLAIRAENGDVQAMHELAYGYLVGRELLKKNLEEAVKWFLKAAEKGHSRSQSYLGVLYESGHGVPQSDSEAVKWYRMAAEQEDVIARKAIDRLQGKKY
jgi:TPR repeat protein